MTITGNGQFQLFGIAVSTSNQIIVITLLTAAATVSAVSGVDKGIKLISGWNTVSYTHLTLPTNREV